MTTKTSNHLERAAELFHALADPGGVEWEVYVLNYDLEDTGLRETAPAKSGLAVVKAGGGCCGASA